jgi:hypothetical protein
VTRIIGNIGDEGNAIRETGGTELYSLPFTPPEPLGGDDYNGKFVVYEWECPDGSKQRSDPCEEPEQEPEPEPELVLPTGTWDPNGNTIYTITFEGQKWNDSTCETEPFTTVSTTPPTAPSAIYVFEPGGPSTTGGCVEQYPEGRPVQNNGRIRFLNPETQEITGNNFAPNLGVPVLEYTCTIVGQPVEGEGQPFPWEDQ